MINLLPPEEKRQLRAARTNTLLARYNLILLGALVFLGVAFAIVYFYLTTAKANADQIVSENTAATSEYANVLTEAQQFRGNLTVAKQILDREIAYSKVLIAIAQVMPSGVVLNSLTLDSETFGTETTLSAGARDYASALAFKDALQASPLFVEPHFQSINAAGAEGPYPVLVDLNVTISEEITR